MSNPEDHLSVQEIPALYRKHLRELLAYLYRFFRNADEAEETVQEVFYLLCARARKGNLDRKNIRAYLYRTAHNLAIDNLRKKKIREESLNPLHTAAGPEDSARVNDSVFIENMLNHIDAAFTIREGEAFRLRYIHGMSVEETAEVLGSSTASTSRLLSSVVSRLSKDFPDALV